MTTYAEIVEMSDMGISGREIAVRVGIEYPANSTLDHDRFMTNAGCALVRNARSKCAAGYGNLEIGTRAKNPNNSPSKPAYAKKSVDLVIGNQATLFAVKFACAKLGVEPSCLAVREEMENNDSKLYLLVSSMLDNENDMAILTKDLGCRTEEDKLREEALRAKICLAQYCDKLVTIKRALDNCKQLGIFAVAPGWTMLMEGVNKTDLEDMAPEKIKSLFISVTDSIDMNAKFVDGMSADMDKVTRAGEEKA